MRYTTLMNTYKDAVLAKEKAKEYPKGSWAEGYGAAWDTPAVHLAAVTFRAKGIAHKRIIDALLDKFSKEIVAQLPFVAATKNPTEVWVYPELIMSPDAHKRPAAIRTTTICTSPENLDPLIAVVKADMEHPKRCQRWESFARTKKTLLKRHKMSVAKLITRHTNAGDSLQASTIRDRATAVEAELTPMELLYTTTFDEMANMYEKGPSSCMVTGSGEAKHWAEQFHKKEKGHVHPTWFYAASPEICGVYIERKGKIAARTLLYDLKGSKHKVYGKVYATSTKMRDLMADLMAEKGHKSASGRLALSVPFTIKAEESEYYGDHLCPLPYVDNLDTSRVNITFDRATSEFYVDTDKDRNVDFGSTRGWVGAKSVGSKAKCCVCGTMFTNTGFQHPDDKTKPVCGSSCMKSAGFIQAVQMDGMAAWKRKEDCFHVLPDKYYATRAAAVKYKCLPMLEAPDSVVDDSTPLVQVLNTAYVVVERDGDKHRMLSSLARSILEGEVEGYKLTYVKSRTLHKLTKTTKSRRPTA